ncbi:hypothetical protein G9444_6821 (plasmid) [Rhodococcus erythropolis]|jgi:hypothetical protein|uniref:Uncharacterized protein n=1 Tax=Rhodococcus erythropolis TaxID=1833 RepID=A0A6G9D4I0_RHOER|nr:MULTISPECIES: hypothetical protein [Rhodococcus]MBS2993019.1 hypothetical protein [Rhodococcus erythropolis]MDV8129181.1 hypothetical protein [Rhodococcus sp. IEGM 1304]QIP44064.1 hypothetical protein G9444_6821 [Rhodococcus erythropolis]RGP48265.1 hypothetical protein AWH04_08625 [Rhodococcus erythropolis]
MGILLVYPIVAVVVAVLVLIVKRRERAIRRATPPWVYWQRGQYVTDLNARRTRRNRTAVGAVLGIAIVAPLMALAGFAGTAQRTRRH